MSFWKAVGQGLNDMASGYIDNELEKAYRSLARESKDRLELIAKSESDLGFKKTEVQIARFLLVRDYYHRSEDFGGERDGDYIKLGKTHKYSIYKYL